MLHCVRLILNRQRTQLLNTMRAHHAEFEIVATIGRNGIDQPLDVIADPSAGRLPADTRICLKMLAAQLSFVKEQILENDRRILASARETELGRRLVEIPVRCSPPPSLPLFLISRSSARAVTLRRGSAWYRGRTRRAARSGSATSPRPGTSI